MTQTTALSTRIAHLEALALPLTELRNALGVQHAQRDEVQVGILEAERAQQQLDLIGLHVGAVLDGHPVTVEITGGADLPDTHETTEPEEAETEANPEPVQEEEPAAPDTADEPTEAEEFASNSEPELEAADPSDDDEDQEGAISDRDRVLAWVTALDGNEFAAADAADELDLTKSASETHLRDMARGGLIIRVEGTGKPGIPSRFRETGREAKQQPEAEAEAESEPFQVQPGPWDDASLSAGARARLLLLARPGLTTKEIALALGKQEKIVSPALRIMIDNKVLGTFGDWPRTYFVIEQPAPPEPARPEVVTQKLTPIPGELNHDERNLFDCLRRESAGLSDRVLAARLNWATQSRVNSILASLTRKGHVGRNGDRFVVIPQELTGEVAS
ncbi:hypothetical protein [Deinococcus sp. UYEF24]